LEEKNMTQGDQLSYHKSVQNKLRTAQHRIEEYQDFMLEIKRFLDFREDRYEDLRDIELLADKLLKVLYEFDNNEEEE
jgi:hypothetical protein